MERQIKMEDHSDEWWREGSLETSLRMKVTDLENLADELEARIASLESRINALEKELTPIPGTE
jgi:vacuolar-type H+-ATPase subunit D/Vma8